MISIMESFFWNVHDFGEKTSRDIYTISDEFRPDGEINKDNLIKKTEGLRVEKI